MLTLQSHVSLSDLTNKAWDTLRAVAQGAARSRALAPVRHAPVRSSASKVDQNMPRIMLRGVERC